MEYHEGFGESYKLTRQGYSIGFLFGSREPTIPITEHVVEIFSFPQHLNIRWLMNHRKKPISRDG